MKFLGTKFTAVILYLLHGTRNMHVQSMACTEEYWERCK